MKPEKSLSLRLFVLLITMVLGSACNLVMVGGQTAAPQVIVVTATGGTVPQGPVVPSPTMEPTLTWTLAWTLTSEPTFTVTTAPVTMTASQSLSCVKGPHWILYEWVASIADGETVTLLARAAPEWEEYYYARKSNGTECWAFGGSSTKSGDPSSLPVKEAPPLPEVTYQIDNKTGLAVCDVLIRGKDETVWGADRLGGGTIAPGASFSLTLTAGFYDVLIRDCHTAVLYEKHDRAIGYDPDYRYTLLNNEVEFYFQNNFAFDLCWIWVKPQGGAWKELYSSATDGHITPGAKAWVKLLVGLYDISFYRCTGAVVANGVDWYIGPDIPGFGIGH
jgi:hypothetical protein